MKKYRAALLVLAGMVCVLATRAFAADNFTGTWKLNLAKSQYDPGPPPRSLTSRVEVMGDTADFTFDGYDATNKSITPMEITIKLDGKDYPIEEDPTRDTSAMKKIDDYTMEETNNCNETLHGARIHASAQRLRVMGHANRISLTQPILRAYSLFLEVPAQPEPILDVMTIFTSPRQVETICTLRKKAFGD